MSVRKRAICRENDKFVLTDTCAETWLCWSQIRQQDTDQLEKTIDLVRHPDKLYQRKKPVIFSRPCKQMFTCIILIQSKALIQIKVQELSKIVDSVGHVLRCNHQDIPRWITDEKNTSWDNIWRQKSHSQSACLKIGQFAVDNILLYARACNIKPDKSHILPVIFGGDPLVT